MSDVEEEYKVETIQRAKVEQDKRGRKTWKYFVKWEGYSQEDNTWEPYTSFVGSEHFVEAFWARVGSDRDHTLMRLFKPGEEMFPVGPPGKIKPKRKSEPSPSKEEPRTSPRRPAKRKETDSEVEVQSIVEEDSEPAPTRQSQRKRRASAIEQAEEAPSTKRSRRSRIPVPIDSDEEVDEAVPTPRTPSRRASTSRARASAKRPEPSSSRVTRASASPAKPSARSRSVARGRRKASIKASEEVIEIDSDSDEPAPPPQEEELASKLSSSTAYVEVETNGSPKKAPPRRTAKPSVDQANDDAAESDSPPAVKTRPVRKVKSAAPESAGPSVPPSNGKAGPSPSVRRIAGSRAGPGRSSKGIVVPSASGSKPGPGRSSKGVVATAASGLTATPRGGTKTARKPVPIPKAVKAKQPVSADEKEEDADAMAVDLDYLAPLTNEELDNLAKLTQTPAPEPVDNATDYEGTSEKDAEGESDHDFAREPHSPMVSPKMRREKVEASMSLAETIVEGAHGEVQDNKEVAPVEEPPKEPEVIEAPKQVVINPPDTAIGGNMERRNSFASWRPPTIFDNISSSSFRATADVPAHPAEPSQSVLAIPISPSITLSVKLQDIQPPTDSARKRLDEVELATQQQRGPPGKFYKGQTAQDMLKALSFGGSCARVVLTSDAGDTEKQNFERLQSYLKEGCLFIAMVGSAVLAFCSSDNADFSTKLGISPNLVGLGDSILVAEVVIADDGAYCDAVINAEDIHW